MQRVTSRANLPPNKAFHTLATSFRRSFSHKVRHEAEQRLVSNYRCCTGCWEPCRLRTQQGCTACQLDQSCNQRKPRAEGTCAMRMTFSSQEHQFLPACIPLSPCNQRRHGREEAIVQLPVWNEQKGDRAMCHVWRKMPRLHLLASADFAAILSLTCQSSHAVQKWHPPAYGRGGCHSHSL